MAKKRRIDTSLRDDNFITESDPIEKLMFIYLLTNPLTKISWIYEIQTRRIAFDTWIDKEMITKILDRFSKKWKVFYIDWRIYLKNFQKHQNIENSKIKKWIESEMQLIPSKIIEQIKKIDDLYMRHIWDSKYSDSDSDSDIEVKNDKSFMSDIWKPTEWQNNKSSIKQKKQTVDFEQFRNLYDKKVWKPKAEKKRYTLKYSEQTQCLEKLPAYLATIKDKQYQKHPMTYLNQRSREDEIYSNAPDYEKLEQFDKQMWIDVQPIKEFFSKKYWPERQQKYSETKQLWKQSPLYLKN